VVAESHHRGDARDGVYFRKGQTPDSGVTMYSTAAVMKTGEMHFFQDIYGSFTFRGGAPGTERYLVL
jgi:hypothetical protein